MIDELDHKIDTVKAKKGITGQERIARRWETFEVGDYCIITDLDTATATRAGSHVYAKRAGKVFRTSKFSFVIIWRSK